MVVHDSQFVSVNFGGEEEECVKRCECESGYVLHEGECIEEEFCPGNNYQIICVFLLR